MKKIKILIVEDERSMRDFLQFSLKKMGYQIAGIAENGEDAVKMAAEKKPDLILMDISLKGKLDGVDAAAMIKTMNNIPLVFLTAHSGADYFQRAREVLPYGYIIKPVDENILYTTLETIIGRIKLEKKLEQSERLYKDLYDNSPDLLFTADFTSGDIMQCNKAFLKTFGYNESEVLYKKVNEIFHPGDRERFVGALRILLRHGVLSDYELDAVRKDGAVMKVLFNASAVYDEKGNVSYCRSSLKDISELKEAQTILQKMNEQLESRVQERTREIVAANNELHQQILTRINAEMELKKHKEMLEEMVFERTREFVAANNRLQEEIKERKRNERDLVKALIVADQASKAKSEFLATMSHEIRTPMNGIIGMSELALMSDLTDRQKEYFNDIKTSAEALLNVINDILDYSKIESGNLSVENIEMDLFETVENAVSLIAARAFQKNIELMCEFESGVDDLIVSDPYRLRQIVLNLVSNAIKFTHEGEIKITVSMLKEFAAAEKAQLKISVKDTGIGIAEDKLDYIFESFKQADNSTTRQYGGSGLGLAISRHLARAMGGELSVKSAPGKGSEFMLELPVACVYGRKEPPADNPACAGCIKTLLIVDDNVENINLLKRTIAKFCDIETLGAVNAIEALETLHGRYKSPAPVDMVIADYKMPYIDGLALVEKIRQSDNIGRVKIIVMSAACDMTPVLARFQNFSVSAFINKPLRIRELKKMLCGVQGMAAENASGKGGPVDSLRREKINERPAAACGKTVMIAEDNEINVKIIREILSKNSVENVIVARDGREAVELFEKNSIDLIFMDVQMPVLDGFAATKQIRNSGAGGNKLPIIAMTANALKGDREKCIRAGMDDYIAKPFKPAVIGEMLSRYLSKDPAGEDDRNRCPPETLSIKADTASAFDYVSFLAALEGDKAIFKEVTDTFINNFDATLKKINAAIREKKAEDLKFAAHNLKGAAGNIFAFRLETLARRIEEKLAAGDFKQIKNTAAELKSEYAEFVKIAREAFKRLLI
ncbi:MAG: Signal transduction histidine-protein kinase BarA [bacterium ADurb.Bin243]|nr:MAG: Signal transduction histidine-protein kinase BarA [bacterium ADurb.Bin243]